VSHETARRLDRLVTEYLRIQEMDHGADSTPVGPHGLDQSVYVRDTYNMKRKLVQAGSSLAVTLPVEVVKEFKLKKGQDVDLTVHPRTGAVTIRAGVRYFEDGKVTKRFEDLANELLEQRAEVYRELAK
jgi:antitoxin component of MazEF toxin-antitoxin module